METLEKIASMIINCGAIEIKDVEGGEDPFVYTTGNRGPGYVMIKGLVGQPAVLKFLTKKLAHKVIDTTEFDFIEGTATGGMIPGWQLRNDVSEILGREIPFCYLRSKKDGGHGELITGDRNNPLIQKGMRALVVEELVNYTETTVNAAEEFRNAGYPVSHAACIFSYDHEESNTRLKEKGVTLIPLITLPQLLAISEANGLIHKRLIQSYKHFLRDPLEWQLSRNLAVPSDTAKSAIKKGYSMSRLNEKEALERGAPPGKIRDGLVYWIQNKK